MIAMYKTLFFVLAIGSTFESAAAGYECPAVVNGWCTECPTQSPTSTPPLTATGSMFASSQLPCTSVICDSGFEPTNSKISVEEDKDVVAALTAKRARCGICKNGGCRISDSICLTHVNSGMSVDSLLQVGYSSLTQEEFESSSTQERCEALTGNPQVPDSIPDGKGNDWCGYPSCPSDESCQTCYAPWHSDPDKCYPDGSPTETQCRGSTAFGLGMWCGDTAVPACQEITGGKGKKGDHDHSSKGSKSPKVKKGPKGNKKGKGSNARLQQAQVAKARKEVSAGVALVGIIGFVALIAVKKLHRDSDAAVTGERDALVATL